MGMSRGERFHLGLRNFHERPPHFSWEASREKISREIFSKLNAPEKRAVSVVKSKGGGEGNGEALFCQISSLFERDG